MESDQITNIVSNLAASHAWILSVLAAIGVLRVIFKPLMAFMHSIADATSSTRDNEILDEVEASKAFKFACWLIDLLASVKVGTQKK